MTRCLSIASLALAGAVVVGLANAAEPTLQLCLDEAADGTPVYPTTSFPDSTKEIMLQINLGTGHPFKKLGVTWVAVDVGAAAKPNQTIGKSSLSAQNFTRGLFPYRQARPLPVGKYRADVVGDDKPWKSVDFTVVETPAVRSIAKPDEFLPLHEGQVWTYSFVQEAGPGIKIDLPGIKRDADGKARATVTMTVAAKDNVGFRVDTRRNETLIFQDWLQLDNRGLVSLQRHEGETTSTTDPPQVMVKWPPQTQRWDYVTRDGTFRQHYKMWGPLPISWSGHEAAGYVMLVQQEADSRNPALSVERHYVPGVGMVRETATTTLGGHLISRQEITLAK